MEFGYPLRTRSVGVHFKPWGLAPFLPMPAAELCDRPVTVEQVWGRPAIAVVTHRPEPKGWDPEAPFHFVDAPGGLDLDVHIDGEQGRESGGLLVGEQVGTGVQVRRAR